MSILYKVLFSIISVLCLIYKPIQAINIFNKNGKTDYIKLKELHNNKANIYLTKYLIDKELTEFSQFKYANYVKTKKDTIKRPPQGCFCYELYFAEFGGRMPNEKCKVYIQGNNIVVEIINKNNGDAQEIFRGLILKHKSGKWILASDANDVNSDEIGGCTEIPIISFENKIIEWC